MNSRIKIVSYTSQFRNCAVTVFVIAFFVVNLIAQAPVKCGIDNLVDTDFELMKGKKVVLVSHAAARCYTGTNTAEVMSKSTSLTLVRILSPEHGFFGVVAAGKHVADDSLYGVEILSLYGAKRKPGPEELRGADVVVIDLQDIGVRSYTYISTMTEVLVACAELGIPVFILDRPNPLGGLTVDGNTPDPTIRSFIARLPTPYVHGMTMGELATMANGEHWLGNNSQGEPLRCDLTVVKCKRWNRSMQWEQTGLPWYPTSPNIPTVHSVRGYAVTGILGELGLLSIGIGTSYPFTTIGAPEFEFPTSSISLVEKFGVSLMKGRFLPAVGKFSKQICTGYHLAFSVDSTFQPYRAAMALVYSTSLLLPVNQSIAKSNGGQMFVKASGSQQFLQCLLNADPWNCYKAKMTEGLDKFKSNRIPYLLYP